MDELEFQHILEHVSKKKCLFCFMTGEEIEEDIQVKDLFVANGSEKFRARKLNCYEIFRKMCISYDSKFTRREITALYRKLSADDLSLLQDLADQESEIIFNAQLVYFLDSIMGK